MLILAFDTSSKSASVSLQDSQSIIYEMLCNADANHSEIIMPAIDDALRRTKISISDISLFACTLGPGSFTGLRIGISTLKGFLLATEKPAAGVSSLEALALNISKDWASVVCPVIDAGRGQVYAALYRYDDNHLLHKIRDEVAGTPEEVFRNFDQEAVLVGNGAIKYADIIKRLNKRVKIASSNLQHIRASSVSSLAVYKFNKGDVIDPDTAAPIYLRGSDAHPAKGFFGD